MKHILIATLGDSPVVVTTMFDLLTKQEQLTIDDVIVLHSSGEKRMGGYTMIDDVLKGHCTVDSQELPFEDAYTEENCFAFLQELFVLLKKHQGLGDSVYLSLAGGRKNMSALMALVAPFYTCVQGLYHVIDKSEFTDKANFKSLQELTKLYHAPDKERFMAAMQPNSNGFHLVPIPSENALHVSESYVQKLHNMTAEQLQELWERNPDEADRIQFTLQFVESRIGHLLRVLLTKKAKKEYEDLIHGDANLTRQFENCLRSMQFASFLKETDNKHALTDNKKRSFPSYVYRKGNTTERPFFHTEPGDIMNYPQNDVDFVVVERFAKHRNRKEYSPSVEELLSTPYQKGQPLYALADIAKQRKPAVSVLIVPMGTQPMIATQLYTLLKNREQRNIIKVILLYPELSEMVYQSMQTAKNAFKHEGVTCESQPVQELEDVTSKRDCIIYQGALEDTIRHIQETFLIKNLGGLIDLALSGGRKGMAALALFAAQRTQLRAVYHTLIASEELERQIEFDMDEKRFSPLKQSEQNNKLFLRAYKAHEADFRLFTVPIGPLHGN
jgi:CRISPR-associated Csx14 family protein